MFSSHTKATIENRCESQTDLCVISPHVTQFKIALKMPFNQTVGMRGDSWIGFHEKKGA